MTYNQHMKTLPELIDQEVLKLENRLTQLTPQERLEFEIEYNDYRNKEKPIIQNTQDDI